MVYVHFSLSIFSQFHYLFFSGWGFFMVKCFTLFSTTKSNIRQKHVYFWDFVNKKIKERWSKMKCLWRPNFFQIFFSRFDVGNFNQIELIKTSFSIFKRYRGCASLLFGQKDNVFVCAWCGVAKPTPFWLHVKRNVFFFLLKKSI